MGREEMAKSFRSDGRRRDPVEGTGSGLTSAEDP